MQTLLLIDGELTGGEGVAESILDPANGAQIATVPEASREQLEAAVGAARSAFKGWSQTTPKDRATLLLKLADRIEGDAAVLAELESRRRPFVRISGDRQQRFERAVAAVDELLSGLL